jgi:flagellar hook assembly protein FlgD
MFMSQKLPVLLVIVFIAGFISCNLTTYPFTTVVETADVSYSLETSGAVDINVENSFMVQVRTLASSEQQEAGSHSVTWDLLDDNGEYPGDGLYTVEVLLNGERVFVTVLEVNKQ